jgi:hypothetical protein
MCMGVCISDASTSTTRDSRSLQPPIARTKSCGFSGGLEERGGLLTMSVSLPAQQMRGVEDGGGVVGWIGGGAKENACSGGVLWRCVGRDSR